MAEFLQTYGQWIAVAVMFLVMMRLHSSGMGCGMGHHQKKDETAKPAKPEKGKDPGGSSCH